MRTVRDGLRWHLIERAPGRYDFASVSPCLRPLARRACRSSGTCCTTAGPMISISSATLRAAVRRVRQRVRDVASRETDGPPWVVPVNEISFFAWAGGDVGIFNPFATRRGDELKLQLLRAAIAAIQACGR